MLFSPAQRVKLATTISLLVLIPLNAAEIVSQHLPDSTNVHSPFALDLVISKAPTQKIIPDESIEWHKTLKVNGITETVTDSQVTLSYSLAAYAPPACSIPAFTFYVVPLDSADTTGTDTLASEPMALKVISQFTMESDSMVSAGFGDPMKAGKFPVEMVLYILGGILLILIALVITVSVIRHFIMKRQNKTFWGAPAVPKIPPYEEAVAALKHFVDEQYIESGELKTATFELSEILKRYIGRRFECHVQESTSSEFRKWISTSGLEREKCNMLERFISETDPVKFANITPTATVVTSLFSDVESFVEDTRPEESEKEDKK